MILSKSFDIRRAKSREDVFSQLAQAFNDWATANPSAKVFKIFEPKAVEHHYAQSDYDTYDVFLLVFYEVQS